MTAPPRPTVLHVEDNDVDADLLRHAFRAAGLPEPPMRARDGVEALAWLRSHDQATDVVMLLDLGLPRKDGFQVLRELREQPVQGRIIVIGLSGHSDSLTRLRIEHPGILAFAKPLEAEDYPPIVRAVAAILEANPTRGTTGTP